MKECITLCLGRLIGCHVLKSRLVSASDCRWHCRTEKWKGPYVDSTDHHNAICCQMGLILYLGKCHEELCCKARYVNDRLRNRCGVWQGQIKTGLHTNTCGEWSVSSLQSIDQSECSTLPHPPVRDKGVLTRIEVIYSFCLSVQRTSSVSWPTVLFPATWIRGISHPPLAVGFTFVMQYEHSLNA